MKCDFSGGIQGIDDYAVSQTSLEQIFNSVARQQEEETNAVRGIMPLDGKWVAQLDSAARALLRIRIRIICPTLSLTGTGAAAPAAGTANVSVPQGLTAGDKFQATVGGVLVELAVPGA